METYSFAPDLGPISFKSKQIKLGTSALKGKKVFVVNSYKKRKDYTGIINKIDSTRITLKIETNELVYINLSEIKKIKFL